MEKRVLLLNMLCYKYVYFYCTRCNQHGKIHRNNNCWYSPAQEGVGEMTQEKKSVTNYSKIFIVEKSYIDE